MKNKNTCFGLFIQAFSVFIALFMFFTLASCQQSGSSKAKIFYINSYHKGYGSSDDVMRALENKLKSDSIELNIFFMDSKRKNSTEQIKQKALAAFNSIKAFKPDVIIASDDNAIKYLIEPHFKESDIPVIFCGVNWSADEYDLPESQITGMLEVLPLRENLQIIKKYYPKGQKLLVLTENSSSAKKNKVLLDTLFTHVGFEPDYALVDDFEQWKEQFKAANDSFDVIYLPTNGSISNWDKQAAKKFVAQHIKIPVITCDDFMMSYAVFGLTKIAAEQGEWAGETALKILSGISPADIPVTKNVRSKAWLNKTLSDKIAFEPDTALKNKCEIIE